MTRIVLKYGLISGAILSAMMAMVVPLAKQIGFDKGMIIGYTMLVLAFLLVFFGIRSYRETVGAGQISFGRALGVGLLIMVIATVCYVVTWEIIYHNFLPEFTEKYTAKAIENVRNSGKPPAQIEQELRQMKKMMNLYNNNIFFQLAVTFLEPLPIGLVMTLISALILRRREPKESLGTGLPDLQN